MFQTTNQSTIYYERACLPRDDANDALYGHRKIKWVTLHVSFTQQGPSREEWQLLCNTRKRKGMAKRIGYFVWLHKSVLHEPCRNDYKGKNEDQNRHKTKSLSSLQFWYTENWMDDAQNDKNLQSLWQLFFWTVYNHHWFYICRIYLGDSLIWLVRISISSRWYAHCLAINIQHVQVKPSFGWWKYHIS